MLTLRLETILEFINKDDLVADIGTDHGYLLKACLEKGVNFVQGVENKKGPYMRAKSNLIEYLNEEKAILSLSDGLSNLDSRIDTVVIAGMGGELIRDIINDSLDTAKKLKKIILEPNIKTYELRKYLSDNSFEILDEEIVKDGDKFYEIIIARYNESCSKLTDKECYFGPGLLKKQSNVFCEKWKERLISINKILSNTDKSITHLLDAKKMITEVLNEKSK